MMRYRLVGLALSCLLALGLTGIGRADELDPPAATALSRIFDYLSAWEYYAGLEDLYSNYQTCRSRGFGEELCRSTFNTCLINSLPVGGVAGAFFTAFELNQLFAVDCGKGECFQCCYVPGNGCHSSFVGFPVLNCNANYGAGTRNAGRTLVVDPDAEPGQACLFTPQTCDHVAVCLRHQPAGLIDAINNDPDHLLHSSEAADWRAMTVARDMHRAWSDQLDEHHTTMPATAPPAGSPRDLLVPVSSLVHFLTARGCEGWHQRLDSVYPFDWSHEQFRIDDESGAFAEAVSQLNAIQQLGYVRLLAGVPNLHARLGVTESRIRLNSDVVDYLGPIGNADRALLGHLSSVGLDTLRDVTTVQDYRLLAVPLAGETIPPNHFNGCTLGEALGAEVQAEPIDSHGIAVNVTIAGSTTPVAGVVVWGDGTMTSFDLGSGRRSAGIAHQYRRGGRYQVVVVLENDAGLQTAEGLVVETSSDTELPNPSLRAVPSEIQVLDLRLHLTDYVGDTRVHFRMEGQPTPDTAFPLGTTRSQTVSSGSDLPFGHLVGWNPHARSLDKITLRVGWFGTFHPIGAHDAYLTLGGLRFGVYSTEHHRIEYVDAAIGADNLRLFAQGSTDFVLVEPVYDTEGRLKIPMRAAGVFFDRLDIHLPQSVLDRALLGPVAAPEWVGIEGEVREQLPDSLLDRLVFSDGFETADTLSWSATSGGS